MISAFDRQHTKMDDVQTILCHIAEELGMLPSRIQDILTRSPKQTPALQEEGIYRDRQLGQEGKPCNWQLSHHFTGLDVKPSSSGFSREHGSNSTNFPKMFDRISGLAKMSKTELFTSEAQSIINDLVCLFFSIEGDEKSRTAEVEDLSLRTQRGAGKTALQVIQDNLRAAEKTALRRIQDILRASRGLFIDNSGLMHA